MVGALKLMETKHKTKVEAFIVLPDSERISVENTFYDLNIKGLEMFKGKKLQDAKCQWNF